MYSLVCPLNTRYIQCLNPSSLFQTMQIEIVNSMMYLEGLSPQRHLTSGPTHTRPSTHSPLGTVGFARCLIRVYSSRSLWEQMLFLRGNKPYYRDTCEYQEPQAAQHTHTHTRTHAHAHVHANTCTQIFVSCSVDQLNVGSKG